MTIIDPLSRLFLHLERARQPMHAGGLQIFSMPEDTSADYPKELMEQARTHTRAYPPFNQRLAYRFGQPFWHAASDFRVQDHLSLHRLPRPGSDAELCRYIAELHRKPLRRDRPLWEFHIIGGLSANRFAVYTKFHHAMMDGTSAIRLLRRSLAPTAATENLRFPWSGSPATVSTREPASLIYRQLRALPAAARALQATGRDRRNEPYFTGPGQAPACILNTHVNSTRQYFTASLSFERIRVLSDTFDTTVNDVILAVCSSALRQYLVDFNALPRAPLIALVPVSLHGQRKAAGNRLGVIFANLATHMADPVGRLQTIKHSVDYWKLRHTRMSSEQIVAHAGLLSTPALFNLLTGFAPARQAFNIVISNMPGPDRTLYLGKARLLDIHPVSIVLDGQALNISLIGYRGQLEFGLTASGHGLPRITRLPGYLSKGLEELEVQCTKGNR